jgi:hypothetical protein
VAARREGDIRGGGCRQGRRARADSRSTERGDTSREISTDELEISTEMMNAIGSNTGISNKVLRDGRAAWGQRRSAGNAG